MDARRRKEWDDTTPRNREYGWQRTSCSVSWGIVLGEAESAGGGLGSALEEQRAVYHADGHPSIAARIMFSGCRYERRGSDNCIREGDIS